MSRNDPKNKVEAYTYQLEDDINVLRFMAKIHPAKDGICKKQLQRIKTLVLQLEKEIDKKQEVKA